MIQFSENNKQIFWIDLHSKCITMVMFNLRQQPESFLDSELGSDNYWSWVGRFMIIMSVREHCKTQLFS